VQKRASRDKREGGPAFLDGPNMGWARQGRGEAPRNGSARFVVVSLYVWQVALYGTFFEKKTERRI
jgi:hypothetical protein